MYLFNKKKNGIIKNRLIFLIKTNIMSYKARVSSSSSSQKKPQMKESSTFDWNSIRNLVEREQNGYIKNQLILSCLNGASQNSNQENVYECDLLLSKFIEFFSFGKLFPNFVQNYLFRTP